jgi:hypothetical protein
VDPEFGEPLQRCGLRHAPPALRGTPAIAPSGSEVDLQLGRIAPGIFGLAT